MSEFPFDPPYSGLRSPVVRLRPLPRGPHGLSAEEVAQNQRERLIAALTEAVYECGYASTSVSLLCRRAGVSRATFYELFEDREDSLLAAFAHLLERLLGAAERAAAEVGEPTAAARAALRRALELLAADPPAAHLLTSGVLAAGLRGVRVQQAALSRLADLLAAPGSGPDGAAPAPAWALVALLSATVVQRLAAGEPASLPTLLEQPGALAPLLNAAHCEGLAARAV